MTPHYALCFEGRLSEELRAAGSPVYMLGSVRFSRPWTVWRARRSLRSLLERQRFDIVVCHECWPHSLFGPVVRERHLPLAFWSHDIHKGRHWLERWAAWTRPDLVIANSRMTQEAVGTIFPGLIASIVHCPVVMPAVDEKLARQNIRTELKTSQEAAVIVLACRLERWKGHSLLLEALAKLPSELDWVCWVAGRRSGLTSRNTWSSCASNPPGSALVNGCVGWASAATCPNSWPPRTSTASQTSGRSHLELPSWKRFTLDCRW